MGYEEHYDGPLSGGLTPEPPKPPASTKTTPELGDLSDGGHTTLVLPDGSTLEVSGEIRIIAGVATFHGEDTEGNSIQVSLKQGTNEAKAIRINNVSVFPEDTRSFN